MKDKTEKIIACAIEVHSTLGPGLLESVYEEALAYEFELRGINFERQKEIMLEYKGKSIGPHRIDFLIEEQVILEIKATEGMKKIFEAQVLTYMKAIKKKVGLLINFNVERLKDGIKRLVLSVRIRMNKRSQRGGKRIFCNSLILNILCVLCG
ncbi:MAG: GxxExxY protein [candidate division WOR-3 bacterium]|nr:GxxExxY protein [candidate division WOR-3 bacterium]